MMDNVLLFMSPCLTLSEYASKEPDYFTSNTTMFLLPGNHTLESNLTLAHLNVLSIVANCSDTVILTCNESTMLGFEHISQLQISDISFLDCAGTAVKSVDQFTVVGCNFTGKVAIGTGLNLVNVTHGNIIRNSFHSLTSTYGGALAIDASSNISISNSMFDHNVALDGGAVYTESAVAVYNSVFSNNVASHRFGGAVYVHYATGVTVISNSMFGNNSISMNSRGCNGCVGGGAVTVIHNTTILQSYPTTLLVMGSVFTNNTAYGAGALGVDLVTTSIVNSNFSYNSAIYNSGGSILANRCTLTIDNAIFTGNKAEYLGGAINAGVISESESKNISIENSIFRDNVANSGGAICVSTVLSNVTLNNSNFYGNNASVFGGALYFYMAVVEMSHTTFTCNVASKGSVLYIRGRGDSSIRSLGLLKVHNNTAKLAGSFFVVDCSVFLYGYTEFSENIGSLFAIASSVSFFGHTRMFRNSYNFNTNNGRLQEGGSVTSFQSEVIFNDVTEFEQNNSTKGGAISALESTLSMNHNVTIKDNTALFGGGIYLYQSDLYVQGNSCLILNNTAIDGGGIYAVSSSIKLIYGSLYFERNSAARGGGTFLESNAKLYVIKYRYECDGSFLPNVNRTRKLCAYHNKSRYLSFVYNSAECEGGAIYVTDEASSGVCASTPYTTTAQSQESECFFQSLALYENPSIVYDNTDVSTLINLVNTNFVNNTAKSTGAILFGGLLDRCTVSLFSEVLLRYLDLPFIPSYDSVKYFYNISNIKQETSDLSSHPVRVCFCEKYRSQPNCDYTPNTITAMKGKTIKVRIAAVDQMNRTIPARIRGYISSGVGGLGPRQTIQNASGNCVESLEYNITSPNSSVHLNLYAEGPCKDIGISKSVVKVEFTPCHCAVGLVPTDSDCYCVCDPRLFPYITECFNENGTLLRQGDFWIDSVDTTNGNTGFVISPHCPFDYCHLPAQPVYLNLSDLTGADKQCAFNRSGMLCGACAEGLSLTLGNSHCASCTNNWLALLILFALAGILLVGLLIACNLTVAVGTINGLVFFANIIAANWSVFLPSDTPKIFVLFIAWINLDLGIETCFYDGMDGYAKVWLQSLFPIYIIFLVGMIIWISEHSTRFAKLFIGRNPVATLATLILLSYTKLLRTIIASLSFSRLKYPDNSTETVWLYDANVSYLKGKHVPLFIAAMLILVIGIGYTLFLLLWKWRRYYSFKKTLSWVRNTKVYSFMDAYNAPFNAKHSYWTGLLLLIRGLLYLISALNVLGDPKINMLCICVVLGALFIFKEIMTTNNIYKKWCLNSLESVFMFNLFLFTVSTLYIQESKGDQRVLTCISLGVTFVLFLGILVYHMFMFTFPGLQKPIKKLLFNRDQTTNESSKLLGFESSYLKRTPAAELRKPLDLIDDSYDKSNGQGGPMGHNQLQQTPTHSVIDGIPNMN